MKELPWLAVAVVLSGPGPVADVPQAGGTDWRGYVTACLDTLIEHGTDRYGPVSSPLLMAMIEVNTLTAPAEAPELDYVARLELGRLHRRATGGCNLWYDQKTIKAMYRVSELTGDAKYARAADAYLAYALEHCRDDKGMLAWGTHLFWNCYTDAAGGDQDGHGPHEILVYHPEWEAMWRINPQAVRQEIEGIWKWHVFDKQTGRHNRHNDGQPGCDFAFSGGSFALAFAFMDCATGEPHWIERARLVADWHWRHRHPQTGLVPDAPGLTDRYDGTHCMTTLTGPFAAQLLHCYELSGDASFRDMAVSLIKAYDRYGWDEQARTYYAMLQLDGTPVPEQARGEGYDAWAPYGPVEVWRTTLYSYEFPLIAAQSAVYAYELSDRDPELLAIARRWAEVIEKNLPPYVGRRWKKELEDGLPEVLRTGGTYAENYAQAISFFVHLYRATREEHYLNIAQGLAHEAVDKLFVNRIFRGHPAKDYYEATNGVGLLLWALLELDAPEQTLPGAF